MLTYFPPRYLLRRHVLLREIKPAESFLEIGPGAYQLSLALAKRFKRGQLVEFHPESKTLYETKIPEGVRSRVSLYLGDFKEYLSAEPFDCAIACEVLEHIEDDSAFLSQIVNQIRPGGQCVLSVPAHERLWSKHDDMVGHLRRYGKSELYQLMHAAGLEEIRVFSYGIPWIMAFRFGRILISSKRDSYSDISLLERTRRSGIKPIASHWAWLGLVFNPITFIPLNVISRAFEETDLSDGYVAVGRKPS
ncbi:MAG: methyltransferase domain-containing protein [Thiohalocapsa sp.]|nr:methyltransferase domain-containing protein [Thiohalocapsa sp.]MCF7990409.1 methyltransferase domain-containing protein [Thiohalocapsa sp.]